MPSLTVVIPALNEEGNLKGTVEEIVPVIEQQFDDYEILIFNDASLDQTGHIANALASKNPRIRVIHNPKTMGLGYNYKKGVSTANKDYVVMIPGDNEITKESFEEMFKILGQKDMVIPYTVNSHIRPLGRQILSETYTFLINMLFGTQLKYFNGPVIHKRSLIQKITIQTDGFAYQTEALLKLLKSGCSYQHSAMYLKERAYGESKAFNLRNVIRVIKSIFQLLYQIRLKNQ